MKPLFEEPCVAKEEIELSSVPHTLNVCKVGIEMFFDKSGRVCWFNVICSETLSENVSTLVVFMFESTFAENFVNLSNICDVVSVLFETFPNGVMFRGTRVNTDDFTDKRFPSVRSVVQPVIDWSRVLNMISGVITRI